MMLVTHSRIEFGSLLPSEKTASGASIPIYSNTD